MNDKDSITEGEKLKLGTKFAVKNKEGRTKFEGDSEIMHLNLNPNVEPAIDDVYYDEETDEDDVGYYCEENDDDPDCYE